MLRLVGVEHRGNVVLDVAGGEQHAGQRQDAFDALGAQPVEPVADDRPGELEKAAFHRIMRQASGDPGGDRRELAHRFVVAAAMAAHHHPDTAHRPTPSGSN
jgi:hypothetical protein